MIIQVFATEDSMSSVHIDSYEPNNMEVRLEEISKQLEEPFYYQSTLNEIVTTQALEEYFESFGDKKICIGGQKNGFDCSSDSECDTNVCKNPREWYNENVAYMTKDLAKLNKGFNIELGLDIDISCNGFTVGFKEKVAMLLASLLDYIENHFTQQILYKLFKIPSPNDPGAIMKWSVDMMAQLTCFIKTAGVNVIKTGGTAVMEFARETLSTTESDNEIVEKIKNTTGTNDKHNLQQKTKTLANTNAGEKVTKTVIEDALKTNGQLNQECVDKVKEFWNELMDLKVSPLVKSSESKYYKTMCELTSTVEKVHDYKKTITIDPSYKPKKALKVKNEYSIGLIKLISEDNNHANEEPNEETNDTLIAKVDYEEVEEIFTDSTKLIISELECPVNSNKKECEATQNMLIDITKCIEYQNEGGLLEGDKTTLTPYNNVCSAMSCTNVNNNYCFKKYKFDGYGLETEITTDTGETSIKRDYDQEKKLFKFKPSIPFQFRQAPNNNRKSLIEKLKRKKDICLYLQAMGKTEKYRLINSYLVAKELSVSPELVDNIENQSSCGTGEVQFGGLTDGNLESLRQKMLQRESSGNYTVVNGLGYAGGYQFGTMGLKDIGYIKSSSSNSNSSLNDPSNWTGKDGINSLSDFLASQEVQDQAFLDYAKKNYGYLKNSGYLNEGDSPNKVIGLVAASHLIGYGVGADLNQIDGNGVSGEEYYQMGQEAFQESCDETGNSTSQENVPNIDPRQVEINLIDKLVNYDYIEKEYNQYVEDYCVRQLDIELERSKKEINQKIEYNKTKTIKKIEDIKILYKALANKEFLVSNDENKKIMRVCNFSSIQDNPKVPVFYRQSNNQIRLFLPEVSNGNTFNIGGKDYTMLVENSLIYLPLIFYENNTDILKESTVGSIEDIVNNINTTLSSIVEIDKQMEYISSLNCRPYWSDESGEGDEIVSQDYKAKKKKDINNSDLEGSIGDKIRKEKEKLWFGEVDKKGLLEKHYEKKLEDTLRKVSLVDELNSLLKRELYLNEMYIKD